MAFAYTFGNQTQANGSWLDANFNQCAELSTNVTFLQVALADNVFIEASGANGSLNLSAPGGLSSPGSTSGACFSITMPQGSTGALSLNQTGTNGVSAIHANIATTLSWFAGFYLGGNSIGAIAPNSGGNGTNYSTTSDAALKVVHGPADGTGLSALPVRNCTFTAEGSGAAPHAMILAQECKAVAPYAVLEPPEGSDAPCMIDYSKLVAPLIAYAQALEARIAVLEAKALVTAPATSPGLIAARSALASAAALPVVQAAIARGVALKGVQNGITQAQTL